MSHRASASKRLSSCFSLFLGALSFAGTSLEAAPAAITVLFMGAASAGGAGGTFWSSELVLANFSESASEVRLEIFPREGAAVAAGATLTLAAGETRRLPDVYAALGAGQGAGTLRVTGEVLAWMRTFNQTSSGTFGMGVPSVTGATAFGVDEPVYFPVSTPADPLKEFRSNLLLLNLETENATFTVASGGVSKTQEVGPGTFVQIDRVGSWLGLPAGRAVLSVRSTGSWHGLVSTIDPATGDPTGVRGLRAAARTVSLFNGVASADGAGGTKWRSEAQIFNAGKSVATVMLELVPRGESGVSATTALSVGPGETRLLADVYTSLGVGSGAGTLKVTGDVLTWVRTFNQGVGATFGTEIPEVVPGIGYGTGAVAVYPIVVSGDASRDFRSNFLVYNHEPRPITLTLTSGAVSKTLDVPAGTFLQKDTIGNWIGLAPGTTTMQVTGNGRWSALVTTIDPGLGDPTGYLGVLATLNPAPTDFGDPLGDPVSATIGPAGGTLASSDGKVKLTVPAGALASPTALTLQPVTNVAWGGTGSAWVLGPAGTTFAKPATLSFPAIDESSLGASLGGVGIVLQDDDGYWQWRDEATRDSASKTISLALSTLAGMPAPSGPASLRPSPSLGPKKDPTYALAQRLRLESDRAFVLTGGTVRLRVAVCYARKNGKGVSLPMAYGVSCTGLDTTGTGLSASQWMVQKIPNGNANVGYVLPDDSLGSLTNSSPDTGMTATYKAPAKRPDKGNRTARIEVIVRGPDLEASYLREIPIVGTIKGRFTVNNHWEDSNLPDVTVEGLEVVGTPIGNPSAYLGFVREDRDNVFYKLSAKLNFTPASFKVGDCETYTCSACASVPYSSSEARYPQFFLVNFGRKVVSWRVFPDSFPFTWQCNDEGGNYDFNIGFAIAFLRNCTKQSYVSAEDPFSPKGSYTMDCLAPYLTGIGTWDFQDSDD